MKKYIEPLLIACIIGTAAIANVWQTIWHWFSRPTDTLYVGISHYYQDYFYYLSQVTQGAQGAWMSRNLYTTEAIPATPLWWTNIAIGRIAGILGLHPWTAYDISLFVASIVSLWLLYKTACLLFPKQRVLRISSFAVSVFTTCYYLVQKNPDGTRFINPFQFFYNYTESLNRLGGVTHLILQNILSLGAVILYAKLITAVVDKTKSLQSIAKITAVFSLVVTLLMFINPVYVAVDAVVFIIVTIGYCIRFPSSKAFMKVFFIAGVTGIPLAIPTLAVVETFSVPFYQYFRWWETSIYPTNIIIYLYSMGPIAILSAIGLFPYLRRGGALRILGFFYIITPVILYFSPIPTLLAFPRFRLMQPPAYIFLAAMAVETLALPDILIASMTKKARGYLIFFILLTAYILFQLPMIRHEIAARNNDITLISWVNNIDRSLYDGLITLKDRRDDKVVLAFNNLELLVPVITGKTVYTGHHSLSYDYPEKIAEVADFYTKKMTGEEALDFLTRNNIGYILWRKKDTVNPLYPTAYPFLKVLFENEGLVIYTP
jgi:hypothetical protein